MSTIHYRYRAASEQEIGVQHTHLMRKPVGAIWHKVEMQIHTPGSKKDFKVCGTAFEDLSTRALLDASIREGLVSQDLVSSLAENVRPEDVAAELIAWKAFQEKIGLICITDHFEYRWVRRVRDAVWNISKRMHLGWGPKILPGVEICDASNHHVVAIFRENAEDQVRALLGYLEVPEHEFGNPSVLVNRTLLQLLDAIRDHRGIAYLPHLDSGERLKDMFSGSSWKLWRRALTHPTLAAVGLRHVKNKTLLVRHLESEKVEHPPFLVDSDAHDIAEIGRSPVWLKMGKPSFDGLCYALEDCKLHVAYSQPETRDRPTVLGLCVSGGFFGKNDQPEQHWEYFRFNPDLTCLVGGRGTGKSTVLLLLSTCLNGMLERGSQRRFLAQFDKALLYLDHQGDTYCIGMIPQVYWDAYTCAFEEDRSQATNLSVENWLSLYVRRRGSKRFEPVGDKSRAYFMRQSLPFMNLYLQNRIYELAKSPEALLGTLDDILANSRLSGDWNEVRSSCVTTCERWKAVLDRVASGVCPPTDLEVLSLELVRSLGAVGAVRQKAVDLLNRCLANKERLSLADWSKRKWYDFLLRVCGIKDEAKESAWLLMVKGIVRRYSVSGFIQTVLSRDLEGFWRTLGELGQYYDDERDRRTVLNLDKQHAFDQLRNGLRQASSEDLLSCLSYPVLLVEHNVNADAKGGNIVTFVNINDLSPGQRCVALLDLILYGGVHLGDERPLVIDQPEDHIDNRYVYGHLVDALRHAKGHRQVILVTHNPNLAVGADTEQIIRLEAENLRGWIAQHGGMDDSRVRRAIIDALEGGLAALELRIQKYFPGSKSVLEQLWKMSKTTRQE